MSQEQLRIGPKDQNIFFSTKVKRLLNILTKKIRLIFFTASSAHNMFSGYFVQVVFPSRCSAVKLCCLPFSSADKWGEIKQRLSDAFCQNFVVLTAHHFSCVYNIQYRAYIITSYHFSARGLGVPVCLSPCQ